MAKRKDKGGNQPSPDEGLVGIEPDEAALDAARPMSKKRYYEELPKLQLELSKLQEWVRAKGLKVVVIFEGRDAAGKGGAIKTITLGLNPRVARIAALPAPTEREKTQWYFQRYVSHLPAAARSSCSTAPGTTAPASSG